MFRSVTTGIATLAIGLSSSACASVTRPAESEPDPTAYRGRSNSILRAEELQAPQVRDGSLLDAIRLLRPNFLVARTSVDRQGVAAVIEVSINDGLLRPLSTIAELRADAVQSVTFFTDTEAGPRFGMRDRFGPVLLVILK